jgi:hypothetical protein
VAASYMQNLFSEKAIVDQIMGNCVECMYEVRHKKLEPFKGYLVNSAGHACRRKGGLCLWSDVQLLECIFLRGKYMPAMLKYEEEC